MPTDPVGLVATNALTLQRLSNSVVRDSTGLLRALFDDIVAELARIDPTGPAAVRYRRDRVARLLERVADLIPPAYADWRKQVRAQLAVIGKAQGEHARQVLLATLGESAPGVKVGEVGINMMKAIVDRNPFQGQTLAQWAETQQVATLKAVRQQVQFGMAREESIDQIAKRLRGTALQATEAQVEAITRTAVNDIATTAAFETYSANQGVTTEYQFVATLDSRTTPLCASLDGKTFAYADSSAPRPPLHFNCRSTIVPVVDWEALGLPAPPGGTRAARGAAGKSVQVKASWDFEVWLKKQTAAFQDQWFGSRARGVEFRSGRKTLGQLVRADGRFVTVESLAA